MIYTTYFGSGKSHGDKISIARTHPEGKYEEFPSLFPSWEMIREHKSGGMDDEEYTWLYNEVLQSLDVIELAEYFDEKTLMCWCKRGKFCHRHLVAKWFKDAGYDVAEL